MGILPNSPSFFYVPIPTSQFQYSDTRISL